jgi:MFS transporter, DHA2 family, methylenomycin A resistance protein
MTTLTRSDRANPTAVLMVMCSGMFLVLLDVTIVNVALPTIGSDMHADVPSLQWVVDGYAVAIASLLLAAGTIGDRTGHRQILLVGFTLFGLASVICASAPVPGVLVLGRVLQGIGGALLLPGTMAVVADVFPEQGAQAKALGTWAAVSSLALPAGPLLGGLLIAAGGWRLVFWINVPVVLATVVATVLVVPARPGNRTGRFDLAGLVALAVFLAGLVFTVIEAGRGGGAGVLAGSAAVTVLAGIAAVRIEQRTPAPNLPLDLLRRRAFLSPNVVAFVMNLVVNGTLFIGTLYLQDVRHHSAFVAGLFVLPMAVPLVLLAPVSGRLTAASGPRRAILLGTTCAVVGSGLLLGVRTTGGMGWLLTGFALLGCGAGLVTASVVAAVVRATPAKRRGLATGMSNTARQTGTATGVALFGALAGSPSSARHFVSGMHAAAVLGAVLWLVALALAALGVEGRGQGAARAHSPTG